jgi:Type IV secretion system pilin
VAVPASGGQEGVKELVVNIATRILQFGALFAIGAIVFSGIRYTTSAGDDEKTKSAKNTLIYAIIGLLLLLTAFPLVDMIVNFIYSLGQQP